MFNKENKKIQLLHKSSLLLQKDKYKKLRILNRNQYIKQKRYRIKPKKNKF